MSSFLIHTNTSSLSTKVSIRIRTHSKNQATRYLGINGITKQWSEASP